MSMCVRVPHDDTHRKQKRKTLSKTKHGRDKVNFKKMWIGQRTIIIAFSCPASLRRL